MTKFYDYKEVVITRESAQGSTTRPGPIVVQGEISKPGGA
jgi:hypothetical protein